MLEDQGQGDTEVPQVTRLEIIHSILLSVLSEILKMVKKESQEHGVTRRLAHEFRVLGQEKEQKTDQEKTDNDR